MNEQRKLILVFVIGLLLGFGGGRLWTTSTDANSSVAEESAATVENAPGITINTDNPNLTVTAESVVPARLESVAVPAAVIAASGSALAIEVLDQPAGSIVIIKHASFSRPGWVVIHEDRGGAPGNILGAQLFARGSAVGVVELLRATSPGGLYYAMLHDDDGDHLFEIGADLPLRSSGGNPLVATFRAR